MYELALCAGVGGLSLGLQRAGFRTICYVERDDYRIQVLIARMQDGSLDRAPVWDDVTTFNGTCWRGCVDMLSAGLPCQPFSIAGDRRGTDDERYLWPHLFRILCEVRPRYVLLENVPGMLMACGGQPAPLSAILSDLAQGGYDAEWDVLPAAAFGAPHVRERVFLVAYAGQKRRQRPLRGDLHDWIQAHSYRAWETSTPLASVWSRLTHLEERLGEPAVFGDDDGTAYRVERLAAVGETVVPHIAEWIARRLLQG